MRSSIDDTVIKIEDTVNCWSHTNLLSHSWRTWKQKNMIGLAEDIIKEMSSKAKRPGLISNKS